MQRKEDSKGTTTVKVQNGEGQEKIVSVPAATGVTASIPVRAFPCISIRLRPYSRLPPLFSSRIISSHLEGGEGQGPGRKSLCQ
jgi:hypothetical protein